MAYIIIDRLTEEAIGPFETEAEAVHFSIEGAELLSEGWNPLDIHEIYEPAEWALNNLSDPIPVMEVKEPETASAT